MKKTAIALFALIVALPLVAQGNQGPHEKGQMNFVEGEGLLVTAVMVDGPAEAAGIRRGDIVLRLDDVEIQSGRDLYDALDDKKGGESVTLEVQRGDETLSIQLTLEERVNRPALGIAFHQARGPRDLGISRALGIGGVLVVDIADESAAEAAGIEAGMIIVEIDGIEVSDPREIVEMIATKEPGDRVELTVVNFRDWDRDEDPEGDGLDRTNIDVTLGESEDGNALLGVRLGRWMMQDRNFGGFGEPGFGGRGFDGRGLRGPGMVPPPDAL